MNHDDLRALALTATPGPWEACAEDIHEKHSEVFVRVPVKGRPAQPTVFVCAACGKIGETRMTVGDESCFLHAVKVWRDSIVFEPGQRRFESAVAACEDWVPDLREVA